MFGAASAAPLEPRADADVESPAPSPPLRTVPAAFAVLLLLLAPAAAFAAPPEAGASAAGHRPCAGPPPGMVCIAGGPAIVGADDGEPDEAPRRTVDLSTFYIDAKEITNGDYAKCVAAGGCKPLINQGQRIMQPFLEPDQPAVPLDWYRAERYCAWAGKRLPTEWEWEKAARGPAGATWPWGEAEPTCERAWYRECADPNCIAVMGVRNPWDCRQHHTKPVASFAPNPAGLFDMGGNGYEWTASWYTPAIARCGGDCNGRDPMGPCQGGPDCPGTARRVLRGGSWYWPAAEMRSAHRRGESPQSGGHRLSARCAASNPWLTRFPPLNFTRPRSSPAALAAPDPALKSIFDGPIREDDIEEKELCEDVGRSYLNCRDRNHYIKSNEPRQYVLRRYVQNAGGGLVGVGSDQNYSLLAAAKSEWAWLLDFDPIVVQFHQAAAALIVASPDRTAFIARFEAGAARDSLKIITDHYKLTPGAGRRPADAYEYARAQVLPYYKEQAALKEDPQWGWLRTDENYAWVRAMFLQGRVRIVRGDLLKNHTMRAVGDAARRMGVPIRIYYPSNAPELWPHTAQYRKNVRGLPMDDDALVVQTRSGLKSGFGQRGYWHYNVASGPLIQHRLGLPAYNHHRSLIWDRIGTDDGDLTILGLKSE